jgi:DNA processing protein
MDELRLLRPDEHPAFLAEIPEPPEQLWLRGTLPDTESTKWLTVVGARAYTPYGKAACEHLIAGLRGSPVVIVSGLALGIDAIAHAAALDAGLVTVAIPGSGLGWDVLYPRTNHSLAHAIIEADGALLSENDPTFRAQKWSFLERNRIMAGISHATLIIEATEQSGTLVTARLATDYNREVLVVPGSIFSETSRGTHRYLRHGAAPVGSAEEILDALGLMTQPHLPNLLRTDISEDEQSVLAFLATPRPRDELIRALALPASRISSLLSAMELKGLIGETMGEIRALS